MTSTLQLTSALIIGACIAYYAFCCYVLLRHATGIVKVKRMLAAIYVAFVLGLLKDFALLCMGETNEGQWCKLGMLFDLVPVAGYAMYIEELFHPGTLRLRTMVMHTLPFVLLLVLGAIFPIDYVLQASFYYTFIYCAIMYFRQLRQWQIYRTVLQANYSNTEGHDVLWIYWAVFISVLCLLEWLLTMSLNSPYLDLLNYLFILFAQGYLVVNTLRQRALNADTMADIDAMSRSRVWGDALPQNTDVEDDATQVPLMLQTTDLNAVMRQKGYYLQPRLTLTDLAREMGTNRTYMSRYINSHYGLTFYEYVNQFRLDRAVELIEQHRAAEDGSASLDEIVFQAGFNSISTFRRAYAKKFHCGISRTLQQI